jgi:hypothetical protein
MNGILNSTPHQHLTQSNGFAECLSLNFAAPSGLARKTINERGMLSIDMP